MVKAISPALLTHIQSGMTSLSTLWLITRKDSAIFCFTDSDSDITYMGNTYLASTGYTPSAVDTSIGLNVDNMEIDGVIDSTTITDADLIAGLWDYATINVMRVNRRNLAAGHMTLRTGTLGEVKAGRTAFQAELRGLTQPMQQPIGNVYSSSCRADFGDSRCGMNIALYQVTGTVTSADSNRVFHDTGRTEASETFSLGKVTFTSGANNGRSMEIKRFTTGGTFEFQESMPYPIAIGDTYTAQWGCPKTPAACTARGNIINFRGFPFVSGRDKLLGG